MHDFTVKGKRLYPQQIAQVNGDVALLENHRYAIINSGMGTGKTLMASCVAESFLSENGYGRIRIRHLLMHMHLTVIFPIGI